MSAVIEAPGEFLVYLATAILFHTNLASRNELLHFEKDLAIAGGMLLLMLRGAGGWSVEGLLRARRPMLANLRSGTAA